MKAADGRGARSDADGRPPSLLFLAQTLHFLLEPCGLLPYPEGGVTRGRGVLLQEL